MEEHAMNYQRKAKRVVERVKLSRRASCVAHSYLMELRERHCKLSLSELVSMIVTRFLEDSVANKKAKEAIEKESFDSKLYLKSVLESAQSEEDIQEAVRQLTSTKIRRAKKNACKRKNSMIDTSKDGGSFEHSE